MERKFPTYLQTAKGLVHEALMAEVREGESGYLQLVQVRVRMPGNERRTVVAQTESSGWKAVRDESPTRKESGVSTYNRVQVSFHELLLQGRQDGIERRRVRTPFAPVVATTTLT